MSRALLVLQLVMIVLQAIHLRMGIKNMANTARLTAAVAHLTTVSTSVVALVTSLATQIRDNIGDDDALNSLADTIEEQANELAAAVTQNTPASGETPTDQGGEGTDATQAAPAAEATDEQINDAPVPTDDNGGDSGGTLTVGDVVEANDQPSEDKPQNDAN